MTGALMKPLARPRLIGSARRDGETIHFTCTGIDSTALDTDAEVPLAIELARVRTPDEATKFIDRFGPLGDVGKVVGFEDTVRGVSTLNKPVTISESVADVLRDAADMRFRIELAHAAKDVGDGVRGALKRLMRLLDQRRWSDALRFDDEFSTPEAIATNCLAGELTLLLAVGYTQLRLECVGPGRVVVRILCQTLRDFCYLSMARLMAEAVSLATCPECSRVFVVEDARQKFCTPQCAGRVRFRRFKERQAERNQSHAGNRAKGGHRGKTRSR